MVFADKMHKNDDMIEAWQIVQLKKLGLRGLLPESRGTLHPSPKHSNVNWNGCHRWRVLFPIFRRLTTRRRDRIFRPRPNRPRWME